MEKSKMNSHPEFAQPEDCNPNPGNESMSDAEFFEYYGEEVDEEDRLPFESDDDLDDALEQLYNRG